MAQVGTYNFDVLVDGKVRDQACYGRDLTLDAGVSLSDTHGLLCATGGAQAAALGSGDYAHSAVFSFIADVTPLDSTPGVRYVVSQVRGDSTLAKGMLLSDASGFFAVEIDEVRYSSGVNVLDGKHNLAVVYDFDGNIMFYVDGLLVHQTTRANTNYNSGDYFAVGRGATATSGVARAVIDNLRLFNDPVYGETEVQRFMNQPVEDMLTAAYHFDANTGTLVTDQSIYGNDLTLTANGAWTTGKNGSAVGPVANTSAAAVGTSLTLGDYDRLNVSGWVRVDFAGSAAPFLSLEAADGSPRFRLYRGGSNGLLMKSWRTDDGTADQYMFGNDGAFTTGGPYVHVAVDINPTGWNMVLNGAPYAGGTNGRPPTNDPIITGLSILRVGGDAVSGPASIDDLRIIRNYLNPDAIQRLMNTPVTQIPRGTLNMLRIDGVQPNAVLVDDGASDVRVFVDDVMVYGEEQPAPEPLPEGLAARWTFDDGVEDQIAGRALTLTSTTLVSARGGQALAAPTSTGTADSGDGFLDLTGFSISYWLYTPTAASTTSITRVAFTAGATTVAELYSGWRNLAGGIYELSRLAITTDTGTLNTIYQNDLQTTVIPAQQWRHVVGVYDGAQMLLYVNGVLVDSDPKTGTVTDPDAFTIRVQNTALVDDVEIWSRPLTLAEITAMYNEGL